MTRLMKEMTAKETGTEAETSVPKAVNQPDSSEQTPTKVPPKRKHNVAQENVIALTNKNHKEPFTKHFKSDRHSLSGHGRQLGFSGSG